MLNRVTIVASTAIAMALVAVGSSAQQAASSTAPAGPAVNDVAPDFSLAGADRYGLLKTPDQRLNDPNGGVP
jgi:hypothetical protein